MLFRSIKKTAGAMFVHYRTISYRLEKIKQISGINFDNANEVLAHCQGSGKNPYQTQVDLQNIAFKCSCPSHKFPCKHSLGLLFLHASRPDLFMIGEEPDWVKEWLEKRAGKAAEKKEKADKPVDAEAQAKRQG